MADKQTVDEILRSTLWLTQVTDMTAPEHWQFYLTESGDLVAVDIEEAKARLLQWGTEQYKKGYIDGGVDQTLRFANVATLNKEPNKGGDV